MVPGVGPARNVAVGGEDAWADEPADVRGVGAGLSRAPRLEIGRAIAKTATSPTTNPRASRGGRGMRPGSNGRPGYSRAAATISDQRPPSTIVPSSVAHAVRARRIVRPPCYQVKTDEVGLCQYPDGGLKHLRVGVIRTLRYIDQSATVTTRSLTVNPLSRFTVESSSPSTASDRRLPWSRPR